MGTLFCERVVVIIASKLDQRTTVEYLRPDMSFS